MSVEKRKPGRPKKYSTDAERKAAKFRQTNNTQKEKQLNHKKDNQYQDQLSHHQSTGYAAQKRWRARKKEEERAQQLARMPQNNPSPPHPVATLAPTPLLPPPLAPAPIVAATMMPPQIPPAPPSIIAPTSLPVVVARSLSTNTPTVPIQ
jgi:hypothetical protein